MFCSNCGKKIDNYKFCPYCGAVNEFLAEKDSAAEETDNQINDFKQGEDKKDFEQTETAGLNSEDAGDADEGHEEKDATVSETNTGNESVNNDAEAAAAEEPKTDDDSADSEAQIRNEKTTAITPAVKKDDTGTQLQNNDSKDSATVSFGVIKTNKGTDLLNTASQNPKSFLWIGIAVGACLVAGLFAIINQNKRTDESNYDTKTPLPEVLYTDEDVKDEVSNEEKPEETEITTDKNEEVTEQPAETEKPYTPAAVNIPWKYFSYDASDRNGYTYRISFKLSPWILLSDTQLINAAWNEVGDGDLPQFEDWGFKKSGSTYKNSMPWYAGGGTASGMKWDISDMYYSVGSVSIENTTSGFDFSEDNPGSILLPLGYYNPYFSTAGRVRYSNKDTITCGGIRVSASMKKNKWGPVPIIFITREFYSPNTPNGMAEFINDETFSFTVASTDLTLKGMKLLSDNTPIHLTILSENAAPAVSVDEPSAGNESATVINGNETSIPEQKTAKVLVNKLNIRSAPSTKASKKGMTNTGDTYTVYDTTTGEGYTWYRIGEDKWIADKNGEWVKIN